MINAGPAAQENRSLLRKDLTTTIVLRKDLSAYLHQLSLDWAKVNRASTFQRAIVVQGDELPPLLTAIPAKALAELHRYNML